MSATVHRCPRPWLGLALGALCAAAMILASACGAASRKGMHASASPPTSAAGPRDPRIAELDAQIDADLVKLGLDRPAVSPDACTGPACAAAPQASPIVLPKDDATCRPGPSDTCRDSCTLADSICTSAASICRIAGELGSDAWANDRCAGGRASCEAARGKCCGCQL